MWLVWVGAASLWLDLAGLHPIHGGHATQINIWVGTEGRGRNQHSIRRVRLDPMLGFGCVVGLSGGGLVVA